MLIRRFFAFIISAFLIFFPAYSYANTSVGGWTALDTITAGANNTINATKTAGGKVLKSAVAVAPSAVKVGKHLIKGGGAAALLLAVPQLIGEGVDWILDPANNAVRYTKMPASAGGGKQWWASQIGASVLFSSRDALCTALMAKLNESRPSNSQIGAYTISGNSCQFKWSTGGSYGSVNFHESAIPTEPTDEEYAYIPIDTVAAQVISNAEAGHAPSQEAVKATALEGFAAGEHDAALEAAATESDAGTENPPDTENPPLDPAPPAEPFDPSSIIAAINSLKAMLAGILSSMTGFFDWVQAPVPPDEEKKDVPFATTGDVGLDEVDRFEQRIDFSGQCPVNDFSFTMMGVTYAKPIPYHHLCGFLEQIAPWLLAMCYLGTAYFVVENI